MRKATMAIVLLCGSWAPAAQAADDDLAVVRRAVQDADSVRAAPAPATRRWFRVRIDKQTGAKVRVNLPLPFVRALGERETWPAGIRCGRNGRGPCTLQLSEVLSALDAGQEFVTIDDEDARIRIWID
jgi:hypothetical protein